MEALSQSGTGGSACLVAPAKRSALYSWSKAKTCESPGDD